MKVVNKRSSDSTVYIGRGSVFGNPFKIGENGTRDSVIAEFEDYARRTPHVLAAIKELPQNAVLGCYCKPRACHGDVIVKLNAEG